MRTDTAVELERFGSGEGLVEDAPTALATHDILVVEDDRDCSRGLSIWLEYLGHSVMAIDDGAEALACMEEAAPKVVFLDLGLPGMHGLKILHEIRMRGLTSQVVVLTAVADGETVARARAMGALEVLGKPVDRGLVTDILDQILGPPREGGVATGAWVSLANASSSPQFLDDLIRVPRRWLPTESAGGQRGGLS